MRFVQPQSMNALQYAAELLKNTLRSGDVYEAFGLKDISIKRLGDLAR